MIRPLSSGPNQLRSALAAVCLIMFAVIARVVGEPETLVASAVGILPLAVGIGYFVDAALIHRDLKPT